MFLKAVKPDLWQQVELQTEASAPVIPFWQESLPFNFVRYENGLALIDNNLFVEVSLESGNVTGFWQSWTDDLVFPDATPAISEHEAYAIMEKVFTPELSYYIVSHITGEDDEQALYPRSFDAKLVYTLYPLIYLSVDANSGELMWHGSPYIPASLTGEYSYDDIADMPEETKIMAVVEWLRLPQEESFRPEEQMTQAEFLRWIYALHYEHYYTGNDEGFYEMMGYTGFWKDECSNADKLLSAIDGVEYFVRFLDYEQYLQMQGLFINPLNLSEEQAAWVALAVGNKAITFASFDEKVALTRLEAVNLIYNYLAR